VCAYGDKIPSFPRFLKKETLPEKKVREPTAILADNQNKIEVLRGGDFI